MSDKKRVPKLRFPGFTEPWEQRKLGEVFEFQYGEFNNNPDNGGEYPIYGANGIIGGYTDWNAENSSIIGHMGAYAGYVVWGEGKHFVTYNGTIARPKDNSIDSKYGYYLLDSKKIYKICAGSGQPFVSYSDLNGIDILLPKDKDEQRLLAYYFTNLDHLITLHQRKLEHVKKMKKSMLQKMFPKKNQLYPEVRFPGFTDAWEQRKLGEIATYRNGKAHEANQLDVGTYELVNLNSISIDGGLKPSGKFIEDGSDTLQRNDLVMVLSDVGHGDLLGRVAIIPENNRYVLNQRVALLRINDDTNTYFLFSIINRYQDYFKKLGAGSSQLNISRGIVENFEVAYPNVAEQRMIADYFQSLDHLITLHQRELDHLQLLKKGMLQQMFI